MAAAWNLPENWKMKSIDFESVGVSWVTDALVKVCAAHSPMDFISKALTLTPPHDNEKGVEDDVKTALSRTLTKGPA